MAANKLAPGNQSDFRTVLGRFPTGVTVVTGADEDGPAGLAIGSFFSVSLSPPLIGFCVSAGSGSWARIGPTGAFCVNVLGDDQRDVCATFASGDPDRFSLVDWEPAESGTPRLHGALVTLECDVVAVHEAGDHFIVIGEVNELEVHRDNGPLLFVQGDYGRFAALD